MSAAELTARYAFGIRADVAGCLAFCSDRSIVYACGKNLVIYNTETQSQQLISYGSGSGMEAITAMAIAPSRRYLAIAEQGAEAAVVTVWDLQHARKRKVLQARDSQSQVVLSMCFSPDSKYLVTQSGRPDWMLTLWNWEKPKSMAYVRASNAAGSPIRQVLFNSVDNTQVSVVGDTILKVYRYSENLLKPMGNYKCDPMPMRCQHWLTEDRLLVGTDTGDLLLFHKGDLKQKLTFTLPYSSVKDQTRDDGSLLEATKAGGPPESVDTLKKIHCITSGSRYVYVSFNHRLQYLDRTEDGCYEKAGHLGLPVPEDTEFTMDHDIIQLVRSPGDDVIAAVTSGNQIYAVPSGFSGVLKGVDNYLNRLTPTFHSQPITGLSVCIRKSLVATCSTDKSVLLWNFETCQQELAVASKEEANSVALHPNGLFMLVGYTDKLRLMGLHINELKECKVFTIRACRECVFSNGGQYFAAVNGNLIQVFNTYTYEIVANFKGHSNKIRGLAWSADDLKLVSCGQDGGVYEWNVAGAGRTGECVTKGQLYSSVVFNTEQKNYLAVAADNSIKEVSTDKSEVLRSFSTEALITQLVSGNQGRMMFAGTSVGTVQSLKCPLSLKVESTELVAHGAPVSKVALSHDGQHLFSASEDGTLFFYKVDAGDTYTGGMARAQYFDDILIPKNVLKEKDATVRDLVQRVDELQVENEYQLRLKNLSHNEVIMEMTEKFHREMEALQKQNAALGAEKAKIQKTYEKDRMDYIDSKAQEFLEMESSNNMKLMDEYEKYEELQAKCQRLEETHSRKTADLMQSSEVAQREIRQYYETKLKEMQGELEHAEDLRNDMRREFEEMKAQIEEDCDREILDDANIFETKMREAKEQNIKLAGEAGVMKKKVNTLAKDISDHKTAIEKLQVERSKLQGVIKTLEKDIQGLKKEMLEREETITDKERQIVDIRKKNQELEKFKFVLDFKIKELKKQIEPRDATIARKDDKLARMQTELNSFEKSFHHYKHQATLFKQKLDSRDGEMIEQEERILNLNGMIKHLKKDLSDALGLIQQPKSLKRAVVSMGDSYLTGGERKLAEKLQEQPDKTNAEVSLEHVVLVLERTKGALEKQLHKDKLIHREEKARILAENVQLIKEINELRGDLKSTRTRVHDLEVAAKSQRRRLHGAPGSAGGGMGSVTSASASSLIALGNSPIAGYGTAVSLPLSQDAGGGGGGGTAAGAGHQGSSASLAQLTDVVDMQNEELVALRLKYRAALAGQKATTVVSFPPIRSVSVTSQG